jgi:nitrogen fixation NifU-like protein
MSALYEKALVDHAKHPRNFGALEHATHSAAGENPLCGDEVHVRLRAAGDRVDAIAFEGQGCAVCLGSASMMTEAVKGASRGEIAALLKRVRQVVRSDDDGNGLGDLAALAGVAKFPARVKCALLAWTALEAALAGSGGAITTELS